MRAMSPLRYINDWQSFGTSTTVDPYTVQLVRAET